MADRLFKDLNVTTADSAKLAVRQMARTCNRLTHNDGFSPTGRGVRLPASLADTLTDPGIASNEQ